MLISEKKPRSLRRWSVAALENPLHRIFLAGLLGLFCGVGFMASSRFNQNRFLLQPAPAFDLQILSRDIPFYPEWVWVYILYYPFCFLPLLLAPVRLNPAVFLRTVLGFGLQFGICFLIFFFWPIRMIHPEIPPGLHFGIISNLYHFDGGFNAFPSLHVSNTVFVALLFYTFHRRWSGWLLLGGAGLIALSALFVKQHYLYDVLAGGLLGWAISCIVLPAVVKPRT